MKTKLLLVSLLLSFCAKAQIPSTYQKGTWKDFKPAAVSYTFDDNTSNQISVAIPMLDNYGYKATLFTVTQSMNPSWSNIKSAAANGHEIASHTVTHADFNSTSVGNQDTELKNSQNTINNQIPDKKCVTVAYPNCNIGDVPTIQKYYIAGRTCSGQINSNNPTDFYRLSSIICGSTGVNTANEMNNRANSAKSSNGWSVFLLHGIDNDGGYSPLASSVFSSHLSYINTNKNDFWVGTFGDVVKYIKERNALNITETAVNADSLRLTPTDNLDNTIYNVGITIRRQMPNGWTSARVRQGNTLVNSSIVTDNNIRYIQFDVIPDIGVYSIANASSTNNGGVNNNDNTSNGGETILNACTEPGEGAFHTGVYRNIFKEILGKNDTEINSKVNNAFNQIFHGSSDQKLYYEVGQDMAYILDVANNDVRSEGMSYGLMICVQLDKQAEFNKLWKWTKTHMQHSSGNLDGYFKWQLRTDGSTMDANPAPDGEAYFITSLFFAANRWGNGTGIFNYEAEAQSTLIKMMNKTGAGGINNLFNNNSKLITFGPNTGSYDYTDPSYNLPAFWELWAKWSNTNKSFWAQTPEASRKLLRDASHSTSGLTTDYSNFDGTPKTTNFNSDSHRFMYDAWRTIMNIGMDYHWFKADAQQPVIAERYLNFFKNQGSGYKNHYDWNGSNAGGDHSSGLVACNAVAALATSNTTLARPFVQEFWNLAVPTGPYRYYDGMLYMLALLNVTGDFKVWKPECENACATVAPSVTAKINYELNETATALAATGTALKWYTAATGGTASSTAPTPNTSVQGTTKYYVSQTLDDCEGPRAEISVTISNTYKIHKTSTAPIIDGEIDEVWKHASVLPLSATKVIAPTITNDDDLSGTVKLLWDDDYIYVLSTVIDDTKYNDSEASYNDDSIELYFDINNDKASTYDNNDVQYTFGWNDGTIVGSLPSGRSVTGITYTVINTSNGYQIEARIPWTTLQGTPSVGKLIGFDFMINDDDNGGERDGKLSWNADTDMAWENPSLFGTAKLMDSEIITSYYEAMAPSLSVFPNPAKSKIHVQGISGTFDYIIMDNTGRVLQKDQSNGEIEISTIESGLYNLVLKHNEVQKTIKFIVSE
jgi:endo-1,4-beta-D-glucanase Y/peptidoglycan/xylan/chitin deacetylase (PgdA/CDA1 family)